MNNKRVCPERESIFLIQSVSVENKVHSALTFVLVGHISPYTISPKLELFHLFLSLFHLNRSESEQGSISCVLQSHAGAWLNEVYVLFTALCTVVTQLLVNS